MRRPPRRPQGAGTKSRLLAFLGRREVLPTVLIAPVVLFFIIWNTIPTLWLLGLSFYRFSLTSGRPPIYSGVYNYTTIFHDAAAWLDLSRTFIFVVLAVGIETVAGFLLGLLFWRSDRLPGRRLALTLLFAPDGGDAGRRWHVLAPDLRSDLRRAELVHPPHRLRGP